MAKILIMDDEPGIGLILKEVLSQNGHDITAVKDGLAGLEALDENSPPDLVIIDYRLPALSGKKVIEKMNVNETFRNIPKIIMSGYTPKSNDFSINDNVKAFVQKPFDIFEVAQLVEGCLKKNI